MLIRSRIVAMLLTLVSLGSGCGDDDESDAPAPAESDGEVVLVVPHGVEDFDAWQPIFEEHREVRAEFGGSRDLVYRDLEDGDQVTVYMTYPSAEQAEAFFADPSLAEAMGRAGVLPPLPPEHEVLREIEVVDYDEPDSGRAGDEEGGGVSLVIRHQVEDFATWKPVFDEHQSVREEHGGSGHRLYTALEDPDDTLAYLTFPSRADALRFYRDPSLAEAMERAGVKPPLPPPFALRSLDALTEY